VNEIATHAQPVWQSKADFLVRADLENFGLPGKVEQLWARRIEHCRFEICCIPFFTYGIALGDIVETDHEYAIQKVVGRGNHRTLRVAVANRQELEEIHRLIHEHLVAAALSHEWYAAGYVAVDLTGGQAKDKIIPLLDELARRGDISYEIDED
jgi:hypothetical protein